MSKGKIIAAVIVLLVVVGVVAAVAMGARNSAPEVETAQVSKDDLSVTVSASGKVEAGDRADVFPPTSGVLEAVYVTDGQSVKAGDPIAALDTEPLALGVEQARAGVSAARGQLAGIDKQAPSAADRAAADAAVAAAWSSYEQARGFYDDLKEVYDETTMTVIKESMEPTLTQLEIAKLGAYSGYQGAKAGQAKAEMSFAAERAAAQAGVDAAEAALSAAHNSLAKAEMEAPIDGIVLFNALGAPAADGAVPKAAEGAAVGPQAAPFTVVQLDSLRFAAEVDEVDIDRVKLGMNGIVTLDAFPGEGFEAPVTKRSSAAQLTATGGTVFPVYLDLADVAKELLIGMKGDVEIQVEAVKATLSVPIEAIFDEDDKQFVYVVKDGAVEKREVETGVMTDTRAQVVKGVKAGEQIALSGSVELKDGMQVRVKQ
ncbi:MAG: hypothetical protein C0418_00145 [Coriobacteriaceae bacterium]|nr:hypothetical protein [Coriobacteriaceae bacterium]